MPNRDRTLEVHLGNCGARSVAWYRTDEDAGTERGFACSSQRYQFLTGAMV
jgi:hypothetical protein